MMVFVAHPVESRICLPMHEAENPFEYRVYPSRSEYRPMGQFVSLGIKCEQASVHVEHDRHGDPTPGSKCPIRERPGRAKDGKDSETMQETLQVAFSRTLLENVTVDRRSLPRYLDRGIWKTSHYLLPRKRCHR